MWTNKDFENLFTFQEVIDIETQPIVFGETTVDEATQAAIIKWFKNRKVSDNENFVLYFQRLLSANEFQYNNLLRVQTIQFDPLVNQYLERLINRDESQSSNANRTGSSNSSDRNTTYSSGTGHSETDTSNTTNTTDKVNSTSESEQNTTGNRNANNKAMRAELPQSSTGAGSGLPENMNWNYASSQDESKDIENTTGKQTSKGKTGSDGTSSSRGTGTQDTTTRTSEESGGNRTGTTTHSEQTGINGSASENVKERSTGRTGDAPEMLTKAVNYISRTNCFFWLVDKLEAAFMSNYE